MARTSTGSGFIPALSGLIPGLSGLISALSGLIPALFFVFGLMGMLFGPKPLQAECGDCSMGMRNHMKLEHTVTLPEEAPFVRISLYHADPPSQVTLIMTGSSGILWFGNKVVPVSEDRVLEIQPDPGGVRVSLLKSDTETLQTFQTSAFEIESHQPEGMLKVVTPEHGYRNYQGRIGVSSRSGPSLMLINTLPLEDYVGSVVGSEMQSEEFEALKAQAVIARTYALRMMQRDGYDAYDMTDDEQYQVYRGVHLGKPYYRVAAEETRSQVLSWSGQMILTPFFSTCGGSTSHNEDVWVGKPEPYLRAAKDQAVCRISPHFAWSLELERSRIDGWVFERYGIRPDLQGIRFSQDEGGRVKQVILTGGGRELRVSGNDFRLMVNERLHPLAMKSTRFDWTESEGVVSVEGTGLGHGVGMCQYGAIALAGSGWAYEDILRFYFRGTNVVSFAL